MTEQEFVDAIQEVLGITIPPYRRRLLMKYTAQIGVHGVYDAATIARRRHEREPFQTPLNLWRYFCGVCRNMADPPEWLSEPDWTQQAETESPPGKPID